MAELAPGSVMAAQQQQQQQVGQAQQINIATNFAPADQTGQASNLIVNYLPNSYNEGNVTVGLSGFADFRVSLSAIPEPVYSVW
jgi:hypothetical protein